MSDKESTRIPQACCEWICNGRPWAGSPSPHLCLSVPRVDEGWRYLPGSATSTRSRSAPTSRYPSPVPVRCWCRSRPPRNNTDVWTRQGAYGLPGDPDALAGWRGPIAFPRIQGGDIAGHVVATGDGVAAERVGQRVVIDPALYDGPGEDANPIGLLGSEADGGFAQYVVVADQRAHDVTDSPLSDEQLACLPVAYGTAAGMLERAHVREGETVVVTGASGGVGFALVQLVAARGARVIAVTSPDKADLIRAGGADDVASRTADDLATTVAELAPAGIDVVADVVGGQLVTTLLPSLVEDGRWVIAGAVAGPIIEFDLRRLYLNNRAIIGSSMHTPAHFTALIRQARAGQVSPRVAATHALADIHAAQREFLGRTHVGKIIVTPPG